MGRLEVNSIVREGLSGFMSVSDDLGLNVGSLAVEEIWVFSMIFIIAQSLDIVWNMKRYLNNV